MAPNEKQLRKGREGLPLPTYYAELLVYWKDELRQYLKPASHIEGLWINQSGKVARKLMNTMKVTIREQSTVSNYVASIIAEYMPNKKIKPSDIRRNIVTLVYDGGIHNDGQTRQSFWTDFALTLNTSVQVIIIKLFITIN